MSVSFLRQEYIPVRREYLDGVLVAATAWASVNLIPDLASLSTFGVFTFFAP